jgi:hypothetical protein
MIWYSLVLALLALLTLRLARAVSGEIERIVLGLVGVVCVLASLIHAPWFVKLLVAIASLSLPPCRQNPLKLPCFRCCVLRNAAQCHSFW